MNTTFERLSAILVNTFKLPPESLTPGASLAGLNIDSLGTVELLWQVEEAFKVALPTRPPALLTLADVVRFIDALVAASGAAAGRPAHIRAAPQLPAATAARPP